SYSAGSLLAQVLLPHPANGAIEPKLGRRDRRTIEVDLPVLLVHALLRLRRGRGGPPGPIPRGARAGAQAPPPRVAPGSRSRQRTSAAVRRLNASRNVARLKASATTTPA